MNRPKVLNKMQEESLWSSCPVNDVDTVLPNRYSPYSAFSLLYCDLYLRDFKESLKHTMLDQESVFEDQTHELHRLYRRQKALMMEREEANNLYSQTQHSLLDSGVSSLTRSLHLMGSCISTSKASVFPPEESAFSKINEAGEKVMDLEYIGEEEEEEEGSKNGEVVNFPKDPAQTRSERAEPEAQELQISTKSQPVSLPGKHGSGPFRSIVQALPSLKNIPFFHKRWSEPPRKKKPKRGAKSTNVGTFTRSKARKGSNIDSSFGVRKDDNHSLSTSSYIPESDHNQKYPEKRSLSSLLEMNFGRSWTKTGKRRRRKKRIEESGKVTREIPRTRSKTLVTEKEEQEKSAAAAEAIVDMSSSSSDSPKKSTIIKTSDCNTTLHWFAKIASSFVEDSKREVGLSVTRSHSNYKIDYFEAMTLQLTEMEPEEQRTSTPVSNIVHPKNKRTPRSKGKRQQLHRDGHNDLQKIGRLIEASETNDAYSSYKRLMENMRFDWGAIRKRRRGIRSPAATTKTCRGFLQVPFSGS